MTAYERIKIDLELKAFTAKNFEKPSNCRNLEQIRFYSSELCLKIEEYENRFRYVPESAYQLLEQYTFQQHALAERSLTVTYP